VELVFTAQEILVGYSVYPTPEILRRQGLPRIRFGYANLGALLMAQGLPYDSAEGRAQAAAIRVNDRSRLRNERQNGPPP